MRPGGLVVVQEPDFRVGITTAPTVVLWQQVQHWIAETFRRGGVHYDIGGRLYHVFRRRDCRGRQCSNTYPPAAGQRLGPTAKHAGIICSLLPRMEEFGIATAADVQVDTLADRLEHETARAADSQLSYVPIIGAWTTRE